MHMVYDDMWDGITSIYGLFIAMYLFRQFTVGFDRPEKSDVHKDEIPPDMLEKVKKMERDRDDATWREKVTNATSLSRKTQTLLECGW